MLNQILSHAPRAAFLGLGRGATRNGGRLGHGVLLGAAIGTGSMAETSLLALLPYLEVNPRRMALFVAMAGVGAGVGMGIDASKKTEVMLHQAP